MDWMLTDDGTRAWARDAFRETRDGEWPDVNTIADCVIDEVARAAVKKYQDAAARGLQKAHQADKIKCPDDEAYCEVFGLGTDCLGCLAAWLDRLAASDGK